MSKARLKAAQAKLALLAERDEALRLIRLGYHAVDEPGNRENSLHAQAVQTVDPAGPGTFVMRLADGRHITFEGVDWVSLDRQGDVVLFRRTMDFIGISCLVLTRRPSEEFDTELNASQARLGQPLYRSPERIQRESLDAATANLTALMAGKTVTAVRAIALASDRTTAYEVTFSDGTKVTTTAELVPSKDAVLTVG